MRWCGRCDRAETVRSGPLSGPTGAKRGLSAPFFPFSVLTGAKTALSAPDVQVLPYAGNGITAPHTKSASAVHGGADGESQARAGGADFNAVLRIGRIFLRRIDFPAHSRGGETSLENCQLLCRTHNRAKGNR